MASEKIRVLKVDHEEFKTKKGTDMKVRVLHCFVECSSVDKEGVLKDTSFVAKTTLFDHSVNVEAGEEYVVDYQLGEGFGADAGRIVPRIVSWTPLSSKGRPVAKPAATQGAVS
ncbi:hypothetical protein [Burkholderia thailandensis]|nr:hypothetical protein [Burkholderia thailandensis]AIS94978.1 hypothetical protein BTHA_3346 [Burkholderia thailandensis MSMB59]AOJ44293.1 hypothetical protein WJ27_03740 [Burkholderia thailandensis]KVG14781.1 hypothetical protein WJ28_15550 [Burkholderia thailandensis]